MLVVAGADRGEVKVDCGVGGASTVELGEFLFGTGKADLQPVDLAEPSFAFGLGDPGGEVVADLDQSGSLFGVWPEHWASDAPLTELTDRRE